ncbi:MAG: hypothetical protein HN591_07470 [Flavobacteriales bacterium]|jgi:hypothetical protein|nr:hypothetical protein [Flavobacteriales bacterium]
MILRNLSLFSLCLLMACTKSEKETTTEFELQFTQSWNGTPISSESLNSFQFQNEAGEKLSIERLRYLLSNIHLQLSNGTEIPLKAFHLVNLQKEESLKTNLTTFVTSKDIEAVSLLFGFDNEANQDGIYPDLNAVSWNVPKMLGGGYHFMQLDGKFENNAGELAPYNFHAIRAVDKSDPENLKFEDSFFEMEQSIESTTSRIRITIDMDISEWFVNPHLWYLESDATSLMPNFEAQKRIAANGKSVFSIQIESY